MNPARLVSEPDTYKGLTETGCITERDEGEAFGRKLDAAGVPVTVTRYNGMIHDYGLLNALSQEPTVRTAINQAGEELRSHLK